MSAIRAGLFDLDGTLLDTAGDLVASANRMRGALGLAPLPADTIASFIGKGTRRLVERCLSATLDGRIDAPELDRAMALFMPLYTEENGRHARLYPGVVEGLREFAADVEHAHKNGREHHAHRMQAADKGDDDGRKAIARRNVRGQLPNGPSHLQSTGKASCPARCQQG